MLKIAYPLLLAGFYFSLDVFKQFSLHEVTFLKSKLKRPFECAMKGFLFAAAERNLFPSWTKGELFCGEGEYASCTHSKTLETKHCRERALNYRLILSFLYFLGRTVEYFFKWCFVSTVPMTAEMEFSGKRWLHIADAEIWLHRVPSACGYSVL